MIITILALVMVLLALALVIKMYRAKKLGKAFINDNLELYAVMGMIVTIGLIIGTLIIQGNKPDEVFLSNEVMLAELNDSQVADDINELNRSLQALRTAEENDIGALIPTRIEEVKESAESLQRSSQEFSTHMSTKYVTTKRQDKALQSITASSELYIEYANTYLSGLGEGVVDNSLLDYLQKQASTKLDAGMSYLSDGGAR